MSKPIHMKYEKCKVRNVNGRQLVFMPDGTVIPFVVKTKVIDKVDRDTVAIIELIVDLQP